VRVPDVDPGVVLDVRKRCGEHPVEELAQVLDVDLAVFSAATPRRPRTSAAMDKLFETQRTSVRKAA
jgi:hypothetical protein